MHGGWVQVAFERELSGALSEVHVGERSLMLARGRAGALAAYDTRCPHRGANLARGGRYDGEAVVCPFHGRRIGLGAPGEDGFCARGYETLTVGGLVFVLLSRLYEHGFAARMRALDEAAYFVPGFAVEIACAPELVIENAFDHRHFRFVHGLDVTPALELASDDGSMCVRGRFMTSRRNPWQDGEARVEAEAEAGAFDFAAEVFSPTVCVTTLAQAEGAHVVITTATPRPGGGCTVRVSLALEPVDGGPPRPEVARSLLRDSRASIEQDAAIWENLIDGPARFAPGDDLMRAFDRFCRRMERS